jgi:hypothetical protein
MCERNLTSNFWCVFKSWEIRLYIEKSIWPCFYESIVKKLIIRLSKHVLNEKFCSGHYTDKSNKSSTKESVYVESFIYK